MKLQNNFTTVEQSRRLLELGVPANSADMYWDNYCFTSNEYKSPIVRNKHSYRYKDYFKMNKEIYIPCFSVGRLMEIFDICKIEDVNITFLMPSETINYIDYLIDILSCKWLDFSKLEDCL